MLILIPNIVYAVRKKISADPTHNTAMVILEQIGRYACIAFMWLPLFVWKFGFNSVLEMLIYIGGNAAMTVLYYIFWSFYFRKTKRSIALALAIVPTCIFLLSGVLLRHWILVISAVLFGVGHIYITAKSEVT